MFLKKFNFFLLQINIFLVFSDYFDVLMSKIIFFKIKKNIILMDFRVKSTLKNNHNHTLKHGAFHSSFLDIQMKPIVDYF
jgi:hypothetical protein